MPDETNTTNQPVRGSYVSIGWTVNLKFKLNFSSSSGGMAGKYWLLKAEPDSRITKGKDVKVRIRLGFQKLKY